MKDSAHAAREGTAPTFHCFPSDAICVEREREMFTQGVYDSPFVSTPYYETCEALVELSFERRFPFQCAYLIYRPYVQVEHEHVSHYEQLLVR